MTSFRNEVMTAEEIELCSTLAGIYFGPDFKDFVSIIGGNDFLTLFHIKQRITVSESSDNTDFINILVICGKGPAGPAA